MTGVDGLLENSSPEVRAVFLAAADLVRDVMPDATEQVDMPDRLLAFGFGPPGGSRLRDFAVALIPHAAHVNVQLADGALLDDPSDIVEGTGKRIRHVKCRSLADVSRPELRGILADQGTHRRTGPEVRS
ncbi:MAG TPA: DUF1801 domain-containing protein [Candidatus Limnocylindria bacterium]